VFQFLKKNIVLSVAFAAALAITLLFAVRLTVATIVWSNPDRHEQPIAGWMTPRYVSRSWNVEPDVVADALGLETDRTSRRMTIEEIAAAQGRSLDELVLRLESALAHARGDNDD
jgi:D-serine deaminase-like pyridoxal phosphate-dependent protein